MAPRWRGLLIGLKKKKKKEGIVKRSMLYVAAFGHVYQDPEPHTSGEKCADKNLP